MPNQAVATAVGLPAVPAGVAAAAPGVKDYPVRKGKDLKESLRAL